jgi:methylated-DNA-[protein]-cysteine S-methyltransferase
MTYFTLTPSPIDDLLLLSDGEAVTGIFTGNHQRGPSVLSEWIRDDSIGVLKETRRQLEAYFSGDLQAFQLPLSMVGTPFQSMVWEGLKKIPYGETVSYGQFARELGVPNASRAVGLANGRNPISIVVPCHRVIGADGKLTGYGGGLPRKQALLELERRAAGVQKVLF